MKIKKISIFFILIICFSFSHCFGVGITVQSQSAILIHADTGKILYEKNSNIPMYPASTTKIMTAILTLENTNLNDIATVSSSALNYIPSGYSTANLQVGEQFTIEQLLHVLLIPSANDAANVLAEHVGGSIIEFSDMMNKKAVEIGCKNTNFVNPSGIHSNSQYSTVYDLALIGQYAMKNPTFKAIVAKTTCSLPPTNIYPLDNRHFNTTNLLLRESSSSSNSYYYPYAIGIKTGFTTPAGNCLVAKSSHNGLNFIVCILGGRKDNSGNDQRFSDAINLFNYAYNNYLIKEIHPENSVVDIIEVKNATQDTKYLNLLVKDNISVFISNKDLGKNILPEITLRENLKAPIEQGETVGHIKYVIEDITYESDLIAQNSVEKETIFSILKKILYFITLPFKFFKVYRGIFIKIV